MMQEQQSGIATPSKPLSSSGTDNHPPLTPGTGPFGDDLDNRLREFANLEFSSDPGFLSYEHDYKSSRDSHPTEKRGSVSGNPIAKKDDTNLAEEGKFQTETQLGTNSINKFAEEENAYEEILKTLISKRDPNMVLQKELLFSQNRQIKDKEKQALAKDLGLDLTLENQRFSHFLSMAVQVNLPIGWKLEVTPGGKIYYFNELERIYSDSHPCLAFFKRLLANNYKRILNQIGSKVALGNTKRHEPISKYDLTKLPDCLTATYQPA